MFWISLCNCSFLLCNICSLSALDTDLSFFSVQISQLRVIAELRHGDIFHSSNIVSSIEFDRDDELFATAGVSRRIKIVNEPADVHCPIFEMSTRSKLSCLSWNKYTKNHIASSDCDGILTVWDKTTRQSWMEYEEHEKRAWSVDFSRIEPSMLVSVYLKGMRLTIQGPWLMVKVWCTKQEAIVINIDMKAIICSVKYNPGSSVYVAAISKPVAWHRFGSNIADADEDAGSYFISAVCWKSDSPAMLTANSQGTIKVLVLAA
ncbi:hypothetical protein REPUB_Repub13aG0273400 [Reevesia pubescens]